MPFSHFPQSSSEDNDLGGTRFFHGLQFLDTTLVVPTVLGFPLRVHINGTTTVGLETGKNLIPPKGETLKPRSGAKEVGLRFYFLAFFLSGRKKRFRERQSRRLAESAIDQYNTYSKRTVWSRGNPVIQIRPARTVYFVGLTRERSLFSFSVPLSFCVQPLWLMEERFDLGLKFGQD